MTEKKTAKVTMGVCIPVSVDVTATWDEEGQMSEVVAWHLSYAQQTNGTRGLTEHMTDDDREGLDRLVMEAVGK